MASPFLAVTTAEKRRDSELRFHLERQVDANIEAGRSPAEARRQAALEFGGLERFKEVRKDRRFAFVSILALTLGIGASTAVFIVVDNALFEPFPYKDQGNLVVMAVHNLDEPNNQGRGGRNQYSYPEFQDYLQQNYVFDALIGNAEDDAVLFVVGLVACWIPARRATHVNLSTSLRYE